MRAVVDKTLSDDMHFKSKIVTRDKEGHFIVTSQEDIRIISIKCT